MDIVMELIGHLRALDFNEVIMVALTVIIAGSAYSQARSPLQNGIANHLDSAIPFRNA